MAPRGPAAAARRPAWPFGVGERADYEVRFGPLRVGNGTMEITGVDTVRGRPAFHSVMRVRGGTLFYKVDDRYESWWDTTTLSSYRHRQDLDEGRKERERLFEIFPAEGYYLRDGSEERQPTVAQPLDDGSFFYFVRTIPLQVGRSYTFNRYFRPDRNPVVIRVVRREKVTVPAGTFDAVVIQPQIKTRGIFGENGKAEIWLSDDERRVMLQMQTRLKFGSLNLYLKSYQPPAR
ncbi:MAG: hypothetical protein AVDCRST_MAG40-2835 [uncultured Gemmatimonadaceae bacterium]|uniref:DUF3108 domain-containing protein n=1 Tax=uncultured Gemmatimonadaceae bacterium TaxID=246130 RepID=A0A6J4M492_9BACT|nr:MAG: hypothetical protein AVDCRST_MAG40-2835 [uncultured Gemmatimonadaceae bacterium]